MYYKDKSKGYYRGIRLGRVPVKISEYKIQKPFPIKFKLKWAYEMNIMIVYGIQGRIYSIRAS